MHPDEQPQDTMQEDQAMHGLREEYEEWLRDEAAQVEYRAWLSLTRNQLNKELI